MPGVGQEGRFPPPRLSARYRISQETFAGTRANGRGAPIAAVRPATRLDPGEPGADLDCSQAWITNPLTLTAMGRLPKVSPTIG